MMCDFCGGFGSQYLCDFYGGFGLQYLCDLCVIFAVDLDFSTKKGVSLCKTV